MGFEQGNWYKAIMTLGARTVPGSPRKGTPNESVDCKDGLIQFCTFAADALWAENLVKWSFQQELISLEEGSAFTISGA